MDRGAAIRCAASLLAVAVVLSLTGCYSDSDYGPPPLVAQTETTPTEDAAAGLEVGDAVPAEIAEALTRDVTNSAKAYPLSDGTFVFTRRDEPLPQSVHEDIVRRVHALYAEAAQGADPAVIGDAMQRELESATTATGKNVLVLAPVCYPMDPFAVPGECYWWPPATGDLLATVDEALVAAEEWIARQQSPELYEAVPVPAPPAP